MNLVSSSIAEVNGNTSHRYLLSLIMRRGM